MTGETIDIWRQYRLLDKARREKTTELMKEYDETVYRPALRKLREQCEIQGHCWRRPISNGFSWFHAICNNCGTTKAIKDESYHIPD